MHSRCEKTMKLNFLFVFMIGIMGCFACEHRQEPHVYAPTNAKQLHKTKAEWEQLLPTAVFAITQLKQTEKSFSGRYWNHHQQGIYVCTCCGRELFSSDAKYESGTGWPSFTGAIDLQAVDRISDHSAGMSRTEIACERCGAHLGHVFDDGPEPSGFRYCINSLSLVFRKKKTVEEHVHLKKNKNK